MKEKLLLPLGMVDTDFWVSPDKVHRLVTHYYTNTYMGMSMPLPQGLGGSDHTRNPRFKSGGGGLVSTATDYSRFASMLVNGGVFEGKRFLKEETVNMMLTNQLEDRLLPYRMGNIIFIGNGFGLGVAVTSTNDPRNAPLGEASWGGE